MRCNRRESLFSCSLALTRSLREPGWGRNWLGFAFALSARLSAPAYIFSSRLLAKLHSASCRAESRGRYVNRRGFGAAGCRAISTDLALATGKFEESCRDSITKRAELVEISERPRVSLSFFTLSCSPAPPLSDEQSLKASIERY